MFGKSFGKSQGETWKHPWGGTTCTPYALGGVSLNPRLTIKRVHTVQQPPTNSLCCGAGYTILRVGLLGRLSLPLLISLKLVPVGTPLDMFCPKIYGDSGLNNGHN
jgi:hypothetical protein